MNYDGHHHGPESLDSPGHSHSSDENEDTVGSWALFVKVYDFRMLLEDHGMPLDEGYNRLRETLSAKALWSPEVETIISSIFEGIPMGLTPLMGQILAKSQYEDSTSEAWHTKTGQPTQSQAYDCQFLTESLHDDSTRQWDSKAYCEAEIYPPSSKDRVVVGMSESGFSQLESIGACEQNPGSTEALAVSDTVPLNLLLTERTVVPEHSDVVPEKAGLPLPEKEVAPVSEVSHRSELGIRNLEKSHNSQPLNIPVTTDPLLLANSSNGFEIDELWDILWLKDDDLAEPKQSYASNARKSVDPEPCVLPDPTLLESKDSEVSQEPGDSGTNLADSSPSGMACSRRVSTLNHVLEIQKFDKYDKNHETARMKFPSGKVPDICGNPESSQKRLVFQSQWLILIYICLTWVWRSCQLLATIMSLVISHWMSHFSGRKRYRCAAHTELTSTLGGVGGNNSSCSYLNRVTNFPMSLVFWDPGGCLGKTNN